MGAGKKATVNAAKMAAKVVALGKRLGLQVEKNVPSGHTVWATPRKIKVVLSSITTSGKISLGVECFCQDGGGTANQKAFAKFADVEKWPLPGVIVYDGPGLKAGFRGVLDTHGAIPLGKLEQRIRQHFGM